MSYFDPFMIFYDVFMHLLVYSPPPPHTHAHTYTHKHTKNTHTHTHTHTHIHTKHTHTHTFGIFYMKYMYILQKIISGLVTELFNS